LLHKGKDLEAQKGTPSTSQRCENAILPFLFPILITGFWWLKKINKFPVVLSVKNR
jgi:hypothetical protein